LHDLDQLDFKLVLGVIVFDFVFDLFHDLGHRPPAVFLANDLSALGVQFLAVFFQLLLDCVERRPFRLE